MKAKTKFLALAVAVIFTGAAYGQTSNSNSTSGAGASTTTTANPVNNNFGNGSSTSASGSQAGAVSSTVGNDANLGVTVHQDFSTPGKQTIEHTGTSTSNVNTNISGTTTLRNVPNVVPPNILPTSPCMGSSSIGGSVAGFGIGGGTSWKDTDCGYRETARVFMQAGRMDDGIAVLCASEYAGSAPVCKNLAAQQKKAEAAQVQANARDQQIKDANDRARQTVTLGQMTKSQQDTALTRAAMMPTELARKQENCRLAGDDQMMRARFECGIYHPVAFKQ